MMASSRSCTRRPRSDRSYRCRDERRCANCESNNERTCEFSDSSCHLAPMWHVLKFECIPGKMRTAASTPSHRTCHCVMRCTGNPHRIYNAIRAPLSSPILRLSRPLWSPPAVVTGRTSTDSCSRRVPMDSAAPHFHIIFTGLSAIMHADRNLHAQYQLG